MYVKSYSTIYGQVKVVPGAFTAQQCTCTTNGGVNDANKYIIYIYIYTYTKIHMNMIVFFLGTRLLS